MNPPLAREAMESTIAVSSTSRLGNFLAHKIPAIATTLTLRNPKWEIFASNGHHTSREGNRL